MKRRCFDDEVESKLRNQHFTPLFCHVSIQIKPNVKYKWNVVRQDFLRFFSFTICNNCMHDACRCNSSPVKACCRSL